MEQIKPGQPIDLENIRKDVIKRYTKHDEYDEYGLCGELREMFRLLSTLSNGMVEISGSALMIKLDELEIRDLHKDITMFASGYIKRLKDFQDIVKNPDEHMIVTEAKQTVTSPQKKKSKRNPRRERENKQVGIV